jgi:predicted DNA-binding transcriptional regulator AlpA
LEHVMNNMFSKKSRSSALSDRHSPDWVYLTQLEVAALLRLSPRTLERHRVSGTGPAYTKLGRRVVYRRDEVDAWAARNTVSSTSEADSAHG